MYQWTNKFTGTTFKLTVAYSVKTSYLTFVLGIHNIIGYHKLLHAFRIFLLSNEKRMRKHLANHNIMCIYPRPLRLLVRLGDGVVEGLALNLGDLELESTGLARAIGARKSTSAPWRAYKHIRNLKSDPI